VYPCYAAACRIAIKILGNVKPMLNNVLSGVIVVIEAKWTVAMKMYFNCFILLQFTPTVVAIPTFDCYIIDNTHTRMPRDLNQLN
jgi:hypothetical protein